MTKSGSLVIVGTGIKIAGDMTINSQAQIKQADIVFMVVPDLVSKQWLASLNTNTVDLTDCYGSNKSRLVTYHEMAGKIVASVKKGHRVCAAFYGHPGVFAYASHLAISKVKALGYSATMEPGVSAEDCLFADLGMDPGETGCMSVEATQFLFYQWTIDPSTMLVLWQIGLIGDHTLRLEKTDNYQLGLQVLSQKLLEFYPKEHVLILYEAATLALFPPRIEKIALSQLPQASLTAISTLVIPPCQEASLDFDMLKRLGLTEEDINHTLNIET